MIEQKRKMIFGQHTMKFTTQAPNVHGSFWQVPDNKCVIAIENVCFEWINRQVKCWELLVITAFSAVSGRFFSQSKF